MLTDDGNVLPAAVPLGSTEMTPGEVKRGWQREPGDFTVWAKISSHSAKKKPVLVYTHAQKNIHSHTLTTNQASQCWCQDHCGCAWLWYGWEAAVPTACLPASPSKCIGAWGCPTTWPSFPTWWSTTTRISQPVIWRWVFMTLHISVCWYTVLCQYWLYWALASQSCRLPIRWIFFSWKHLIYCSVMTFLNQFLI